MPHTKIIDLADILTDREETVAELEDARRAMLETAEEEYGDYTEVPEHFENKFDRVDNELTEAEAKADSLRGLVDKHEDTAFRIKRLSGGEVAELQDKITEESFDFDVEQQSAEGTPKTGYAEVLWTRRSVVKAPEWVDNTEERGRVIHESDPANLPWKAFEALSEAVDNFNTTGEASLGNTSLREEMQSSG